MGSSGSSRAAVILRRSPPSRVSSSPASTPRPTAGWTSSAPLTSSRASWRSRTPSSRTSATRISSGERWEFLAGPGPRRSVALGFDADEEPRLPRRHVRRGADRRADRQHDAAGDDRGVPDHGKVEPNTVERDLDERASSSAGSPMPASTTTTLQAETLEQEGVQKFADSFEEPRTASGRRAGSSSPPRRREP